MSWFSRKLRGELPRWVESGVISGEQRVAIENLYPAEADSRRVITLFAMMGAAVIAVGVLLLISANWTGIHDWAKIVALVGLLVGTYATGQFLRVEPGRFPRIGDALLMLGCVLFMGGIALVSQTFHLNARPPSGVLVWWLGIVAVPLLTRSQGAQCVSTAAGLIWLAMELGYTGGWLEFTSDRYDPVGVWAAAGFLVGAAMLMGGLGLRRSRFATFAGLHEYGGLVLLQVGLYAGGFARHAYHSNEGDGANVTASVVLLALALGGTALAAWGNRHAFGKLAPWLALGAIPALASLAGLDGGEHGAMVSFGYCLALFVFDIALVYVALKLGRPAWINLALGFVALNVFTRYWDLFGSMLDSGVFFVASGLVILGLAFGFAKGRRRLARAMEEGEVR